MGLWVGMGDRGRWGVGGKMCVRDTDHVFQGRGDIRIHLLKTTNRMHINVAATT